MPRQREMTAAQAAQAAHREVAALHETMQKNPWEVTAVIPALLPLIAGTAEDLGEAAGPGTTKRPGPPGYCDLCDRASKRIGRIAVKYRRAVLLRGGLFRRPAAIPPSQDEPGHEIIRRAAQARQAARLLRATARPDPGKAAEPGTLAQIAPALGPAADELSECTGILYAVTPGRFRYFSEAFRMTMLDFTRARDAGARLASATAGRTHPAGAGTAASAAGAARTRRPAERLACPPAPAVRKSAARGTTGCGRDDGPSSGPGLG